jgi:hypothetical protein
MSAEEIVRNSEIKLKDIVHNLRTLAHDVESRRVRVTEETEAEIRRILEFTQNELNAKSAYARQRLSSAGSHIGFTFKFFSWAYLSRLGAALVFLLFSSYLNALSSAFGMLVDYYINNSHLRLS